MSEAAGKKEYSYHTPAEFFKILEKSPVKYTISQVEDLTPFNLVEHSMESDQISQFHRIIVDTNKEKSLIEDVPKGKIAELYEKAAHELQQQNFLEVRKLYEEALSLDSTYFKTWTNLGDTYYLTGDYEEAERLMKKALTLNEIGYQEYFFLADIYDRMHRSDEAIDAIAHAYMLNKNSLNVQRAVNRLLDNNGFRLREDRLVFPFQIKRTGISECEIQLRKADGLNWMGMANCMACWEMEPQFHDRLVSEDRLNATMDMYRECLANQGVIMAGRKNKGEPLSKTEELLTDALLNHYINPIIYWEIMAGEVPRLMLLLPAETREQIVEYIKKYVFEKVDNNSSVPDEN